jgi:hypothetical protein
MKKLISVTVILLFIGLAFAPTINANISKEELVEFTTEICGLNGGKQTVKLTQQQADEVEVLFNSIREQLNTTESRQEAEEIFKDAVVELDKYGLLGGLGVKQAQRLVTGGPLKSKVYKSIENRFSEYQDDFENYNFLCLITGKTTTSDCIPSPAMFSNRILINLMKIFTILYYKPSSFAELIFNIILGLMLIQFFVFLYTWYIPLRFAVGNGLTFGLRGSDLYGNDFYRPSEGWLVTYGLLGRRRWEDKMYGHICPYFILFAWVYTGARGFTGLVYKNIDDDILYYLGTALFVNIGSKRPNFPWLE